MSTQNTTTIKSNDDSSKGKIIKHKKDKGFQDILFIPQKGQVVFLEADSHTKLQDGEKDTATDKIKHYLADKIIDEIAELKDATNEECLKIVNKYLFGQEELDITPLSQAYSDDLKFTECISLVEKEAIMVANEFLEQIDEEYVETVIDNIEEKIKNKVTDFLEDYKIEGSKEAKAEKKKRVLDEKLDKKIRSKCLEKLAPKVYRQEIKDNKGASGETKKMVYDAAKELVKHVELPDEIEEFIDGTKVDLMASWEESYAFCEGKRDFNKQADKDAILELFDNDPFSQDDAHEIVRGVRDLWYKKETEKEFLDNFKTKTYTAEAIYISTQLRNNFKELIHNEPVPPNVFTATAEGALMRFTAKASGKVESNLSAGKIINASGEASAKFALAEGKAEMQYYIPNENGYHAQLKLKKRIENINWDSLPEVTIDNSLVYPANFHFDSSFIAPHTAKGLVGQVSSLLESTRMSGGKILGLDIVGHTDAVGADEYNQKLGLQRAEAAYAFLKGDYVGLAYFFQQGIWTEEHLKFMQAYVYAKNNNSLIRDLSAGSLEIKRDLPNLTDAIINPDLLSYSIISFERHIGLLKDNYGQSYEDLANSSVQTPLADLDMPKFKDGLVYLKGYSNDYIIHLLEIYRDSLCNGLLGEK